MARDLAYTYGRMAEDMKGSGRMASSTDKENTFCQMVTRELDSGKMARELNGLIMNLKIEIIVIYNNFVCIDNEWIFIDDDSFSLAKPNFKNAYILFYENV